MLLTLTLVGSFLVISQAEAGGITESLEKAGKAAFGTSATVEGSAGRIGGIISGLIGLVLGFVGTVAFIVFLMGGYLWLTARGNTDQVEKAQGYLRNGTIGIIVIILAYAFTYFVTDVVFRAAS